MRTRQVATVVGVYVLAHIASAFSGHRADNLVHDLAFSYAAILAGLLIGAVGVFLTVLTTLTEALKNSGTNEALDRVGQRIGRVTSELREDVLFALFLVAVQGGVEVVRVVEVPALIWPIALASFSKSTVLNAIGLSAAVLEMVCVIDCVRAMFTLHDASELLSARKGGGGGGSAR